MFRRRKRRHDFNGVFASAENGIAHSEIWLSAELKVLSEVYASFEPAHSETTNLNRAPTHQRDESPSGERNV